MSDTLYSILPWFVTYGLLIAAAIGAFIPILPSHLLVVIAAGAHWGMLNEEAGVGMVTMIILVAMLVISQVSETLSGSLGSKRFGGSKWGTIGALVGVLVGLFFPPLGFVLGPLCGALLLELIFGKKNLKEASSSGVGSAVGTLTGLLIRMVIALLMIIYLLLDIYLLK